jgi:hypothetical protein
LFGRAGFLAATLVSSLETTPDMPAALLPIVTEIGPPLNGSELENVRYDRLSVCRDFIQSADTFERLHPKLGFPSFSVKQSIQVLSAKERYATLGDEEGFALAIARLRLSVLEYYDKSGNPRPLQEVWEVIATGLDLCRVSSGG